MADYRDGAGWHYTTNIKDNSKMPDNGLILTDVSHDYQDFAKEIVVLKIWIKQGEQNYLPIVLGPELFDLLSFKAAASENVKAPYPFSIYTPVEYIRAEFLSKKPIIKGGSRLKISQEFIFTHYSNTPHHEDTGALWAARIFPLVKFEFPDESQSMPDDCKGTSIRVDYRFHPNLTLFLRGLSPSPPIQPPGIFQQAGLFRDADQNPAMNVLKQQLTVATIIFDSAEKPLKYEVVTKGLVKGANSFTDLADGKKITTWDNIHIWGGIGSQHIPSAPGAFHCFHFHWRWSNFLQDTTKPQYTGQVLGGPLLDHGLQNQTMQLAIISNTEKLSKNLAEQSTVPFEKFFYGAKGVTPADIGNGADLLYYFSVEAFRESYQPFSGTFLVQGIFFAHDEEPSFSFTAGRKSALYKNPKEPEKIFPRFPRSDIASQL